MISDLFIKANKKQGVNVLSGMYSHTYKIIRISLLGMPGDCKYFSTQALKDF